MLAAPVARAVRPADRHPLRLSHRRPLPSAEAAAGTWKLVLSRIACWRHVQSRRSSRTYDSGPDDILPQLAGMETTMMRGAC
jgi:hypothetical protein